MNAPLSAELFPQGDRGLRRFRAAGEVTLDLFHRDGRVDAAWLGLTAREFALLWRLAEQPGERIAALRLRTEAWRTGGDARCEHIGAHIARVQGKFAAAGVAPLLAGDPEGGFYLDVPPVPDLWRLA